MKNLFMALLELSNRFGDITSAQMYNEQSSSIEFDADGDKKVRIWVDVKEKEQEN